jgi:RNA recognition motif-containing protein
MKYFHHVSYATKRANKMYHPTYFSANNDSSIPRRLSSPRNLIVNYLPNSVNNDKLYSLFEKFGPIESFRVIKDINQQPKGYGFVKYVSAESAQKAIDEMTGYAIDGKRLKVSVAGSLNAMHQSYINEQAQFPHAIDATAAPTTPAMTYTLIPIIMPPIVLNTNSQQWLPVVQQNGFFVFTQPIEPRQVPALVSFQLT